MKWTWHCGICKRERADEAISIISFPMKGLPGATINIKYCNDDPKCYQGVMKKKEKGEI